MSANRLSILEDIQQKLNRAVRRPILDVPTRWSSIFQMLQRFDQIYVDLQNLATLGHMDECDVILLNLEMGTLRDIIKALKPLEEFTRTMEGDKYITISQVPYYLHRCREVLKSLSLESNESGTLANALLSPIDARLGFILRTPNIALCSAALDPRYGHLNFVDETLRDDVWKTLGQWAVEYCDVFNTNHQEPDDDPFLVPSADATSMTPSQIDDVLAAFRRMFEDEGNRERLSATTCPLQYRKFALQKNSSSSCLKFLILCLFCIPAASASSERVFSKANLVISRLRSRMMPTMARNLIFISEWSKQRHFKFNDLLNEVCLLSKNEVIDIDETDI